jgi:hypothetical protein
VQHGKARQGSTLRGQLMVGTVVQCKGFSNHKCVHSQLSSSFVEIIFC